MARGRGVKNDVVPGLVSGLVIFGQERGKFVKRGDLGGAGTGQLLAHGGQLGIGGVGRHLRHHALAVGLGGVVGVDVQNAQARHERHHNRSVFQFHAQHFIEVGSGVGADQQHLLSTVGQVQRHRCRQRGFAHSPLAGEKQMPRRVGKQVQRFGAEPQGHRVVRGYAAAVHQLAVHHHSRCVLHAHGLDALRVGDLADLHRDTQLLGHSLKHAGSRLALGTTGTQNLHMQHALPLFKNWHLRQSMLAQRVSFFSLVTHA